MSFVISELERLWRWFLIDLNASEMLAAFKRLQFKAKVTEYKTDPDTVHEAWVERRMIVTATTVSLHHHLWPGSACELFEKPLIS
jgi:hypothetical protein